MIVLIIKTYSKKNVKMQMKTKSLFIYLCCPKGQFLLIRLEK